MDSKIEQINKIINLMKEAGATDFEIDIEGLKIKASFLKKLEIKKPKNDPTQVKSTDLSSIESEIYKDLDMKVAIPQLTQTI